jgi:hypothetical protein
LASDSSGERARNWRRLGAAIPPDAGLACRADDNQPLRRGAAASQPSNIVVVFWSLGVEENSIYWHLISPGGRCASCRPISRSCLILAALLRWRQPQAQLAVAAAIVLLGPALRLATALRHPDIDAYVPFFQAFRRSSKPSAGRFTPVSMR